MRVPVAHTRSGKALSSDKISSRSSSLEPTSTSGDGAPASFSPANCDITRPTRSYSKREPRKSSGGGFRTKKRLRPEAYRNALPLPSDSSDCMSDASLSPIASITRLPPLRNACVASKTGLQVPHTGPVPLIEPCRTLPSFADLISVAGVDPLHSACNPSTPWLHKCKPISEVEKTNRSHRIEDQPDCFAARISPRQTSESLASPPYLSNDDPAYRETRSLADILDRAKGFSGSFQASIVSDEAPPQAATSSNDTCWPAMDRSYAISSLFKRQPCRPVRSLPDLRLRYPTSHSCNGHVGLDASTPPLVPASYRMIQQESVQQRLHQHQHDPHLPNKDLGSFSPPSSSSSRRTISAERSTSKPSAHSAASIGLDAENESLGERLLAHRNGYTGSRSARSQDDASHNERHYTSRLSSREALGSLRRKRTRQECDFDYLDDCPSPSTTYPHHSDPCLQTRTYSQFHRRGASTNS